MAPPENKVRNINPCDLILDHENKLKITENVYFLWLDKIDATLQGLSLDLVDNEGQQQQL